MQDYELLSLDIAKTMYSKLGYQVECEVNRGRFKQVFLANYQGTQVALKVLHIGTGDERVHLEFRARREVQIMTAIDSPYIAKVLDFNLGGLNHEAYIAEEFLSGRSLKDKLDSRTPSVSEAMRLMDDIFQALQQCAKHQIVHRDVKPSNIMLRENGQAVLTDFGLARPLDETTMTVSGMMIGTLSYAPPELLQFNSSILDETSDLFSFGIIAYEMLTGQHPFIKNTMSQEEKLKAMRETQAVPLSELNSSIPQNLSEFVMKLIRREKADRYPSIERSYSQFRKVVA